MDKKNARPMADPQNIKARVNALIEHELARCRALHGSENWIEHGDWVRENVVAAAIQWMLRHAQEGTL